MEDFGGTASRKMTTGKTKTYLGGRCKMDLRDLGWDSVDWIDMAQNKDQWRALVNTALNLPVP
jgi:hypothetical protein